MRNCTITHPRPFDFQKSTAANFFKPFSKSIFLGMMMLFATSVFAQTGEALDFGNSADRVAIGNLGTVDDWTVETWFKPLTVTNYENLFHTQDVGANNGLRMEISSNSALGRLYIYFQGTGFGWNLTTLTLAWHHVAVVGSKSTNNLKIYFDGVLVKNQAWTSWPTSFPDMVLGRGFSTGGDRDFNGQMDEFRAWNYGRTASEITNNKDIELTGNESGLMAYYNFNQGTAGGNNSGVTTLNDLAAPANNGTLTGFVLTGTSSNWVAPGAPLSSAPEINLQGNSTNIADGDNTPSTADHTDFNANSARTFTILNTGNANLTVSTITSDNAKFTVGPLSPASPITGPSGSSTFTVTYSPTDGTVQTATITINNNDNDSNEAAFDFAVTATCAPPTVFSVTGGGGFCSGGAGVAVGLSGSQTGVNYQLKIDGTDSGSPVAGSGSVISFGNQTAAGTYTVVATATAGSCTATMTGTATVTVNPLPTVNAGTYGPVCIDAADIALAGTPTGGTFSGTGVSGNNFDPSAGTQTVSYFYTNGNGCSNTATTVISVNPLPTAYSITGGGGYCSGGAGVAVGLFGSQSDVNYHSCYAGIAPACNRH